MKIEQRGRFYTAQGGDPASLRDALISRYNLGEDYSFFIDPSDDFMVAMPPCATMMWLKTHSTLKSGWHYVTLQEFKG